MKDDDDDDAEGDDDDDDDSTSCRDAPNSTLAADHAAFSSLQIAVGWS